MTLTNPAYVISGAAGGHGAQLFRQAIGSLIGSAGGIVQAQDLALAQNGTPNMSVNVGPGRLWVPGTSLASVNPGGGAYYPQGPYFAESDATVNLPISAADVTNPRVDTLVCQIQDAFYTGVINAASLAVLTGTPTPGATLSNLSGAAAVPASTYVLGYALAAAGASSIVTANIANKATMLALSAQNYLQLLSSQKLQINSGTSTVSWTASQTSAAVAIAHGLGRTPIWWGAAPLDYFVLRQSSVNATNINVAGWYLPGSVTGTGSFNWVAIG